MNRRSKRSFRQPRLVITAAVALGGAAGCNILLGLPDFKDDCPQVEEGKDCPDAGLCPPGNRIDCYTGPDGTEDVGICHGGKRTCGNDGLYGPCEGDQKPEEEVCGNGQDDDCNGKVDDCPCTPGKTYACYTAKDQTTKDVGNCKSGTHVCQPDGISYGACKHEVLPASEDYDKKGDENCDGVPSADTEWANLVTGPGAGVYMTGVAADAAGAVYVSGQLKGTVTLGSLSITSVSANGDGFLGKLDATGKWQWAKVLVGALFGAPLSPSNALTFDEVHDQLIGVGETTGIDFGGGSTPVPQGIFVAAFDPTGKAIWSDGCAMPGTLTAVANALTVDADGAVTFGGDFQGTLTCGTTNLTSASSVSQSAFVAQVTGGGAPVWAMSWGDSSTTSPVDQHVFGLAAAADGIWATGALRGKVIIGTGSLNASGNGTFADVFLIKIKPTGRYTTFSQAFGDASGQEGSGLTIGPDGNVYITGYKEGTIDFGSGPLAHLTGDTVFVAAFDATGAPLWSQGYGGSGSNNDYGTGIAVQPSGDVMALGQVHGGINFGGGAFVSGSATYSFLARLRPDAGGSPPTRVWAKYYGGDTSDDDAVTVATALTLARRSKGTSKVRDVVAIGQLANPANLGGGTIGPVQMFPYLSGFVVRVAP